MNSENILSGVEGFHTSDPTNALAGLSVDQVNSVRKWLESLSKPEHPTSPVDASNLNTINFNAGRCSMTAELDSYIQWRKDGANGILNG